MRLRIADTAAARLDPAGQASDEQGLVRLDGMTSNDVLRTDDRAGRLAGWFGDDMLMGGSAPDALSGGAGRDTLIGGPDPETLEGGEGPDLFADTRAHALQDRIEITEAGNSAGTGLIPVFDGIAIALVDPAAPDQTMPLLDVPRPTGLATLLRGIGDIIRLDGLDGRGVLLPDIAQRFIGLSTEPTALTGGDEPDILSPGQGDDLIAGGAADDLLAGGRGNDTLIANGGSDVLISGEGRDAFVILATASSSAVQVATDLRV